LSIFFFFGFFFMAMIDVLVDVNDPAAGLRSSAVGVCFGPLGRRPLTDIKDGIGAAKPQWEYRK
jgi:hypothetical protein